METQCFDSLNIDDFTSFYLMLDTSQEGDVLKQLYRLDTAVEQEPLYLYEPWNELISVSPYLVKATPAIAEWFDSQRGQLDGFLFCSSLALESLVEHLRSLIKVQSPYGSSIILKSAHSGCANVLFSTETDWYWQHIDEVWLPYKKGWAHYLSPCTEMKSVKPYRLTDEQWQALGELATENAYAHTLNHVEYFFPHCLDNVTDKQKWIQYWFDAAYSRGFQNETEVCLFMNVMGYLGKEAITTDKYPKITELIYQTSQQTPAQRIKQAADLAHQYRHSMQKDLQE